MSPQAFFRTMAGSFLILFLYCPAHAQMVELCEFKSVQIPYDLSHGDVVIEKGTYDLEALKNPTTPSCYLRFKKGKQVLCQIEGERLEFDPTDDSYPDKPTLKFKRNVQEKKLLITVATGKAARRFPLLKIRFTLGCEE